MHAHQHTMSSSTSSVVFLLLLAACSRSTSAYQIPFKSLKTASSRQQSLFASVADEDVISTEAMDDDDEDPSFNSASLRSFTIRNLRKDQEPGILCDFLMELGACSTSLIDADRGTEAEEPLFGEPSAAYDPWRETVHWAAPVWNKCELIAHFPASMDLEFVTDMITGTFADDYPDLQIAVDHVPNKDWVVHVQQGWKPILVSDRILLRFPWHTDEDVAEIVGERDVIQLRLQGGIAFGTGEHPTTQLCLEWIDRTIRGMSGNVQVLDYGSGSGVLGLAACAVSSRVTALGIDIDFDSCRIANDNAAINGLNMRNYLPPLIDTVDSESKSLLLKAHAHAKKQLDSRGESGDDVYLPTELETKQFDVCVANILAGPLITLAPTLASLTKSGGRLGLSGILQHQGEDVAQAYREVGFENVKVERELGGWVLVTGQKI